MNYWHTHEPRFTGTHTHEINGSAVEHTHDDGPTEAVVVFGARWKRPKAPATGIVHDIEVDDSHLGHSASES